MFACVQMCLQGDRNALDKAMTKECDSGCCGWAEGDLRYRLYL